MVDAVLPRGVRLFYIGMIGIMVVFVTTIVGAGMPLDWWFVVPVGLLVGIVGQYVMHLRRAQVAGRLLPRYVEAACAEASREPGGAVDMKT